MRWIIAIVLAGILWTLSAMPFVDQANQIQMLQLLGLNLRTAFVQMGALILMFPIVDTIFLMPLREAMTERTKRIEATYTEVEGLRDEMSKLKTDYEQRLAATEAEAREQIQNQIKEAQNLRGQLMQEASAKADELVKKAQEEIENEKVRVLHELRTHVVDLTLSATERVLGENMTDARNRKLVEEFIDKVEVPS